MNNFVKLMFGEHCFWQNPQKLTVSRGLKTERYTYLDGFTGLFITQGEPCIVCGEGIILGENADDEFLKIYSLLESGKARTLLIFGCMPITAVISSLKRLTAPGGNFVRYEITFTELPKRKIGLRLKCRESAVVQRDESLWNIAVKYEIPVEKLMELNPQVASPYSVTEGQVVNLV